MSSRNRTEKLSTKEKLTKLAAGTLIALGAVGLSACAPNTEAQPAPTPTATESEAPSSPETETPVERYEGSDFERADPLPADLEYLNEMTVEEFKEQPKLEQLRWASWADQYKEEFVEFWNIVNPNKYNAPYTLTMDSDPYTILEDMAFSNRIAANWGSDNLSHAKSKDFNGPLDRKTAEKYIIAHTIGQSGLDNFMQERINSNSGQAINIVAQARAGIYDLRKHAETAEDYSEKRSSIEIDGISYDGWTISYTSELVGKHSSTIAVIPITDYTGADSYASIMKQ